MTEKIKLETWKPLNRKVKNAYLIVHEGVNGIPIAQLKVSKREFWGYIARWLKDEFNITVEFIVEDN